MLIDITQTLSSSTPVYPGDAPFSIVWTVPRRVTNEGGACVSAVTLSPHAGTHVDAPMHLVPYGDSVGALALEPYIGPACVMDLTKAVAEQPLVTSEMLGDLSKVPSRVLLKTRRTSPRGWTENFSGISPGAIEALARAGVVLLGTDTPSLDPMTPIAGADPLAAHHAAAQFGMAILENLNLEAAVCGEYELIALPMKWVEAEASPVRAVLRRQ